MGISFARTIVLYISVIIAMRIMGKRTIGEMHPTELVVSIMISDLATVPMQSKATPLFDGIVPIFTLVVLELVFAFLILKSRLVRRVLVGRSCHVVSDGKLLEREMARLRVTVDDIEEQIRINGYTSLKDIEEVVVETNGQVSVIAKKSAAPVSSGDMGIENGENVTPHIIIADGRLREKSVVEARVKHKEIERAMKKCNCKSVREVMYACAVNGKIIHMQKKDGGKNA